MPDNINTPDEMTEDGLLRRAFSGSVVRKIDKDARQIEFVISTPAPDRYKDIIEVNGWDLKNYKKNPVVLFGHNSSIPPIGKAVKTWKDGDSLKSIAEFMSQDISPFAHSVFRMYEEKFLRAVSVGFKPLKYEWLKDDEGNETGGIRFTKQELLEFSAVPIPANPEALVAARSKGIDTMPFKAWAEEMLDNWNQNSDGLGHMFGVGRKEMEAIRRRAAGVGATFVTPPDVQDMLMKKNLEAIRAAKAAKKSQEFDLIKLGEKDFKLAKLASDQYKECGQVVITLDEVNGKKVMHIDKADDTALFAANLLGEDEFHKVETRGEGDAEEVILTLSGDDLVVEYNLVGVNEDGDLVGLKVGETDLTKATDDEDDDEMDDEDEDDDKSSDEDEEEDKSTDEDEEDDEKSSDDGVTREAESDEEASLDSSLSVVEMAMCELESFIDKGESPSRHSLRKMTFLAGYMRELADRLDGGKKDSDADDSAAKDKSKAVEEKEEGLTAQEAAEYVGNLTKNLTPLLEKLISDKVNKIRGRLD